MLLINDSYIIFFKCFAFYILFISNVEKRFDRLDLKITDIIGRNYAVMIDKYRKNMFLVNMRFSDNLYKGCLFDGILLKDNCQYPDYFE